MHAQSKVEIQARYVLAGVTCLGEPRPVLLCDDNCKVVLSNSCCALDKLPFEMQLLMVEQVRSILLA